MKPTLLLFLLSVLLLPLQTQAQFSFGLKGGYTKAWQDYGDVPLPADAQTHIHSVNTALLAYYRLGKHFQIGIEPGFVRRGAACEPGFIIFNSDTKLGLNYLNLPLMGALELPFWKKRCALISKLGVGPALLLSADREVIDLVNGEPSQQTILQPGSDVLRWDWGAYGSVGVAYQLGKNRLLVESSYYYGVRDVIPFTNSQNRGFHVQVGYLIDL